MLDPNTPAGTKVLCVDTRGCFCACNCGGGHDVSPLKEGRVYTVRAIGTDDGREITARAGFAVILEEIDRSDEDGPEAGYAPDRFIPLEPRWRATRRADRAPIRSKKLEEA
ncbi:hypothetical protein [Methylocella sp.]|uniref:hypothetical protein n=1 Tax=Methylocella sp. TaxID=1978226 RepID=UPI0037844C6F